MKSTIEAEITATYQALPSIGIKMRIANRMLNNWIEKNMPVFATSRLKAAKSEHEKVHAELIALKSLRDQVRNEIAETDNLLMQITKEVSLTSSNFASNSQQQQIMMLLEKRSELFKRQSALDLSYNLSSICPGDKIYYYLDPEQKDDSYLDFNENDLDFEARHKNDLKKILQEANFEELADARDLIPIMLKIRFTIRAYHHEKQAIQNIHALERWARLSLWLIENYKAVPKKTVHASSMQMYKDMGSVVESKFIPAACEMYIALAYDLLMLPTVSDFDLLLAESWRETARNIIQKSTNPAKIELSLKHTIACLDGRIAYQKGEYELFLQNVEMTNRLPITDGHVYHLSNLKLAAEHYRQKDPLLSKVYYERALNFIKIYSNQLPAQFLAEFNIEQFNIDYDQLREQLRKSLHKSIKASFPESEVTACATSHTRLEIYFPTEKLSASIEDKLNKHAFSHIKTQVFNGVQQKGKIYTGIRIQTDSLDKEAVFNELRLLQTILCRTQSKTKPSIEQSSSTNLSPSPAPKIFTFEEERTINPGKKKKPSKPLENTNNNNSNNNNNVKNHLDNLTDLLDPVQKLNGWLAKDFGFSKFQDSPVTPIYCSQEGQRKREPQILVVWEGVPDIAHETEALFKEMMNPTAEGLVTVGMVNQPGPKLCENPTNLGTHWGDCGLRFKRKGHGGGWMRIWAIPQESVEIKNPDEAETEKHTKKGKHRYLFSLGTGKHK